MRATEHVVNHYLDMIVGNRKARPEQVSQVQRHRCHDQEDTRFRIRVIWLVYNNLQNPGYVVGFICLEPIELFYNFDFTQDLEAGVCRSRESGNQLDDHRLAGLPVHRCLHFSEASLANA